MNTEIYILHLIVIKIHILSDKKKKLTTQTKWWKWNEPTRGERSCDTAGCDTISLSHFFYINILDLQRHPTVHHPMLPNYAIQCLHNPPECIFLPSCVSPCAPPLSSNSYSPQPCPSFSQNPLPSDLLHSSHWTPYPPVTSLSPLLPSPTCPLKSVPVTTLYHFIQLITELFILTQHAGHLHHHHTSQLTSVKYLTGVNTSIHNYLWLRDKKKTLHCCIRQLCQCFCLCNY